MKRTNTLVYAAFFGCCGLLSLSPLALSLDAHNSLSAKTNTAWAAPTKKKGKKASAKKASAKKPSAKAGSKDAVRKPPRIADLEAIKARLLSDDHDEARTAIDDLITLNKPVVIPALSEMLRAGRPNTLTDHALKALGLLAHNNAYAVLEEFTHHRRANARLLAYKALKKLSHKKVNGVLEQGLSDSSRQIRALCALELGKRGHKASADKLFIAFERGVVEAAISIGKLADQKMIDRFGERLGKSPLPVMLSGYDPYLRRRDVKEKSKLKIVEALNEFPSPQVRGFLERYRQSIPAGRKNDLTKALDKAIKRMPKKKKAGGK